MPLQQGSGHIASSVTSGVPRVQVTYDPSLVSYEDILKTFWGHIDPTQVNGQGGDRGTQYRTGIYPHTEEQLAIAMAFLSEQAKEVQVCSYSRGS